MTAATTSLPGYVAGTWDIDAAHSDVSFSVRHMMVSKVKGRFGTFSGTIVTAEDPAQSSVTAEIDMSSIDVATGAMAMQAADTQYQAVLKDLGLPDPDFHLGIGPGVLARGD